MKIKVLGSGCDQCDSLYILVRECLLDAGIKAEVEKVEDLIEIVKLGVMSVPAVMVDGEMIVSGQVPSKSELLTLLEARARG